MEAEVAKEFLAQVVAGARTKGLTSNEQLTVDGTLLEAWAGAKSFQRKGERLRLRQLELGLIGVSVTPW